MISLELKLKPAILYRYDLHHCNINNLSDPRVQKILTQRWLAHLSYQKNINGLKIYFKKKIKKLKIKLKLKTRLNKLKKLKNLNQIVKKEQKSFILTNWERVKNLPIHHSAEIKEPIETHSFIALCSFRLDEVKRKNLLRD